MAGFTSLKHIDLEAEAGLDPHIIFDQPLSANAYRPKHIFLTGSTGLLGGYMIEELLRTTTADIYCLIRGRETEGAKQRLIKHLQFYGRWDESFDDRIIPILGDLSKPLFGLSPEHFDRLASHIDVIYHSGGWVNNIRSYEMLKPTNVSGTEEVIRLASRTQTKPVHFVSSMAVFFTNAHAGKQVVRERDIPKYDPDIRGGYKQTKWVADKLVRNAQERGLPAAIYRPVRITAESETGMTSDFKDLLNLLIKSCLYLKKFPKLDVQIPMVPVDYTSQAIVHLSKKKDAIGGVFHFFCPEPIPWQALLDIIRSLGYDFEEVDYKAWRSELKSHASQNPDKKFLTLLQLLLYAPHNLFFERPPFGAEETLKGLADTSIACPPIDEKLISTYLAYFQKVGFLPSPEKIPS